MVDLLTSKELLTYYTANNMTWSIGNINEGNYSKINLQDIPTFYLFNSTNYEIKRNVGTLSFSSLQDFISF